MPRNDKKPAPSRGADQPPEPAPAESAAPSRPYNIALLVADDFRADHVSAYGYQRLTTPNLDAAFARGSLFKNCISPTGWTLTACASILTGHLADAHGLTDHNQRFQKPKLGDYLGDCYHRIAFTNNGNTIPDTISKEYLESLGLERRPAKWKFFGWNEGFDEFIWTAREDHFRPFQQAAEFLRSYPSSGRRKPYFLFFHTNLVHDYHMDREYYLEVQDWLGREIRPELRKFRDGPWIWRSRPAGLALERMKEEIIAKYDSGVRATDRLFKGLLDEINFDDTIVIFVSDHGEGFKPELGRVHHCGRLHQDLLHVPLAVWLPPELRRRYTLPAVEERFCSTVDLVPTVLALLGRVVDGFPGRLLFDLSTHRRIDGIDRGYIYWGQDCRRESYDTSRIEIRSELIYPLKHIEVRKNDLSRHYVYNLAYDPQERDNLIDRRRHKAPELEPVTFIVAVNDRDELDANLLDSPAARSARHQWILVDNAENQQYKAISPLYFEAAQNARHDLVFFMHQDLYLPEGWEENVARALLQLERHHPEWGVIGAAGAIAAVENGDSPKQLKGHWCDPHGYHRLGPLPHQVESLDEQWLGLRKKSGLQFDPDLPGFHCYGIDISLAAREAERKSFAIDAFVWHKYRDSRGRLISCAGESPKIRGRWTESFMAEFNPSADYVEKKWSKYLPFQTTSWTWKMSPK